MAMNEDDQYDMWRDDCDERLRSSFEAYVNKITREFRDLGEMQILIEEFVEQYVKPQRSRDYFALRPDKVWRSIASIAQNNRDEEVWNFIASLAENKITFK